MNGGWTARALEDWLIARIAVLTGTEAALIDPGQAVESYGLTSVMAVGLSGELEDLLGISVDATVAWDYPTVAGLAAHLASGAASMQR